MKGTILATLHRVQVGNRQILAGHSENTESVFVLRKIDTDNYALHEIEIDDSRAALRSILPAAESESNELVVAILETEASA